MRSKLCTIRFFLNTVKKDRNGYPIYVRITYDRKKSEITTGESCPLDKWKEKSECTKNDERTNEQLHFIKNEIIRIKRELEQSHTFVSAKLIKDSFLQSDQKISLTDYFKSYINKIEQLKEEFKPNTVKVYKTALKHLEAYLKLKKRTGLQIHEFNGKMVNDFDFYLMTNQNKVLQKACNRNSTNKYHTKVKSVLINAIRNDFFMKNPYDGFVLRRQKARRSFLTEKEVNLLKNHCLAENKSLDRVRDIYMFSVYTGLRFKDAISLKDEGISSNEQGNLWISIVQEKTGEDLNIPMLTPAIEIYHKYKEERKRTGYVLPRFSNQKINAYLKTITEITGINKNLTHHTARHTFATTITLSNDVPLEVVSKMLGHTSIKSTQIYATIENQYLSKVADRLNAKL